MSTLSTPARLVGLLLAAGLGFTLFPFLAGEEHGSARAAPPALATAAPPSAQPRGRPAAQTAAPATDAARAPRAERPRLLDLPTALRLRPGDRLVEVDGRQVRSDDPDLPRQVHERLRGGGTVEVCVQQAGGGPLILGLRAADWPRGLSVPAAPARDASAAAPPRAPSPRAAEPEEPTHYSARGTRGLIKLALFALVALAWLLKLALGRSREG